MTAPTPEQRAELREAAFKCEGGLSAWYRRRIIDVIDALDAAEQDAIGGRRVKALHESYGSQIQAAFDSETDALARAERAEAALARVEALAEKWAGWGQVDSIKANTAAREIRAALNGADA